MKAAACTVLPLGARINVPTLLWMRRGLFLTIDRLPEFRLKEVWDIDGNGWLGYSFIGSPA
jgi:hypothetical protein